MEKGYKKSMNGFWMDSRNLNLDELESFVYESSKNLELKHLLERKEEK